jgi:hypothetical protein
MNNQEVYCRVMGVCMLRGWELVSIKRAGKHREVPIVVRKVRSYAVRNDKLLEQEIDELLPFPYYSDITYR